MNGVGHVFLLVLSGVEGSRLDLINHLFDCFDHLIQRHVKILLRNGEPGTVGVSATPVGCSDFETIDEWVAGVEINITGF